MSHQVKPVVNWKSKRIFVCMHLGEKKFLSCKYLVQILVNSTGTQFWTCSEGVSNQIAYISTIISATNCSWQQTEAHYLIRFNHTFFSPSSWQRQHKWVMCQPALTSDWGGGFQHSATLLSSHFGVLKSGPQRRLHEWALMWQRNWGSLSLSGSANSLMISTTRWRERGKLQRED